MVDGEGGTGGAGTPPAGWYPDPEYAGQQRYWDGRQWTDHRAPLSPQPAAPWSGGQAPTHGTPGTGVPAAPQNQKALWSMILGILGLVCCWFVASVPAVILGHLGRQEIDASGGAQTGRGMAQAGFVMGIIGVALSVLAFLAWILLVVAAGVGAGAGGTGV